MSQTLAEKLLSRAAGRVLAAGETATCRVDLAMVHEAGAQMLGPLSAMGVRRAWNPERIVAVIDHWAPASNEKAAVMHQRVRELVRSYGISRFYDLGNQGVCHQILVEQGHVSPGMLVVGTDSHTTMAGALGAFATGIGPTEMAAVFGLGELWMRVPESVLVTVQGTLPRGVSSKDLTLAVMRDLGVDGALYRAVEFTGTAVSRMPVWERFTLTNMAVEMGGKAGLITADRLTAEYLRKAGAAGGEYFAPDEDAHYATEVRIDAEALEPLVAVPHSPDRVQSVSSLGEVRIDQAFLGSCTNGRLEDLRIAARLLRGSRVAAGVRFIVTPASHSIYRAALAEGLIADFADAGAIVTPAGCGACFGGHIGVLGPGEVCISSSNRNFSGRMGSAQASIYLASPAVVAASAIAGKIVAPEGL